MLISVFNTDIKARSGFGIGRLLSDFELPTRDHAVQSNRQHNISFYGWRHRGKSVMNSELDESQVI